jgi:hypothetical protein
MTNEVARDSIGELLKRNTRRKLGIKADPNLRFANFHMAAWAKAKMGKSDLGLRARTSEVRLPTADFSGDAGEIVIPSKPLVIAYANFDRDPASVVGNLPEDVEIITEDFYLDENGDPLLMPTVKEFQKMLKRLHEFMAEAVEAGCNLFFLEGGTIIWEDIREGTLPNPAGTTPEGEAHHLPRQYGPSNKEMRGQVMQRLYGLPMHTYLTTEAGVQWSSASKPDKDPETGEDKLRLDGWAKTENYSDCLINLRIVQRSKGMTREAIPTVALRPTILGKNFPNPSFALLYKLNLGAPLLLPEDRTGFLKLEAEHGSLSY